MIREFQYTFHGLEITPTDYAELTDFNQDDTLNPFSELIETVLKEAPVLCEIRAGFKYFDPIEINSKYQNITIDNQTLSPGKIIFTQLKSTQSLAIFVCTAGAKISNRSKLLAENGNHLLSYFFDVTGNLITEKVQNKLKDDFEKEVNLSGFKISDSYSPGFCNWNIIEQLKLFSLLPQNFCGISLSESMLMHPIKSVSGIFGVGKTMTRNGYRCNWCNDMNCLYRKTKQQKRNKKIG